MTYFVTYKIEARFIAAVDADSIEEAKREARLRYEAADFGETESICGEPIIVEDEDGNYLWEK